MTEDSPPSTAFHENSSINALNEHSNFNEIDQIDRYAHDQSQYHVTLDSSTDENDGFVERPNLDQLNDPLVVESFNQLNDPNNQSVDRPKMRRFLGVDHPPGALYSLSFLILINFINYVDRYIPSAVKTQIAATFDLTDFESSLPLTVFVIVYMAACPVFGYLSDRGWDRRRLMCFGVCSWSVFTALAAVCRQYGWFMVVRALVGIGEASYSMIAPAIISDFYPPAVRGRILGWYYAAIPIGAAIGFALGGSIGEAIGWRWAFVVIGAPGVALGLGVLTITDPPRGGTDKKRVVSHSIYQPDSQPINQPPSVSNDLSAKLLYDEFGQANDTLADESTDPSVHNSPDETQWYVFKQLLNNPTFVIATCGQTLSTFGAGGAADWFPVYMQREFGFSEDTAGFTVGGCTVLGGLFGTLVGSYLADWSKWRIKNSYLAVSGLSSLISALLIFSLLAFGVLPAPVVLVLVAMSQIGLWMNIGPITAVIANVVDARHRARAFAVSTFFQHALGDAASPSIIGAVSDATSLRVAAILIPASWIVSGLIWLIGSRLVPDHQREHHLQEVNEGKEEVCESVFEDMEGEYEISESNQCVNVYEDDEKYVPTSRSINSKDHDDLLIDDGVDEAKDRL